MRMTKIYSPHGDLMHTRPSMGCERKRNIWEIYLNSLESIGEPHTTPTYKDDKGNIVEWIE